MKLIITITIITYIKTIWSWKLTRECCILPHHGASEQTNSQSTPLSLAHTINNKI